MAISGRTRKILWGRSGNRCAICRRALVAEATLSDPAAVVGEECHITAQGINGPRATTSKTDIDSEDNLILLCRVDHKRVDDQVNYFTTARLRAIKLAHESWVHSSLSSLPPEALSVRIRRKDSRPTVLQLLRGGSALLAVVLGSMAYEFDNDPLRTEYEVELVAGFLQALQEYGEADDDLQTGDRVRARFELDKILHDISEAGFLVYGAQVHHLLEGGNGPPSDWPIATIRVKRAEDVILAAMKAPTASDPSAQDTPSKTS